MHFRLAFNGAIQEAQCNALRARIAQIFERSDCESLVVLFSSDGGSLGQSLSLYNFLQELPRPIQFHAIGPVGSAAIPAFLGAQKRTAVPFTRFLLHGYDYGFEGRQNANKIKEASMLLETDTQLTQSIIEKHTSISAADIRKALDGIDTPMGFTPDEAKKAGIIEDVGLLNKDGKPEPNVAIWTVGW